MLQKYSFIPIFLFIFLSLACWAHHLQWLQLQGNASVLASPVEDGVFSVALGSHQIELIETLDKIVDYQRYYHSVYGYYTKLMNKIGFKILPSMTEIYDIRVAEANTDRLLVTAFSELDGKIKDLISIDQDYQLHSNFTLPFPRSDYLKMKAMRYLRLLKDVPSRQSVAEEGIFKGYFRYSMAFDSNGEKIPIAEGIRSPVLGVRLQFNVQEEADLIAWSETGGPMGSTEGEKAPAIDYSPFLVGSRLHTGENKDGNLDIENRNTLAGEVYLAQKIFYGEVGRYAQTWSELAAIVHFRFAGKDHYELNDIKAAEDEVLAVDLTSKNAWDKKNNTLSSHPNMNSRNMNRQINSTQWSHRLARSHGERLEIEPISVGSKSEQSKNKIE